jgi:hypothetical protein
MNPAIIARMRSVALTGTHVDGSSLQTEFICKRAGIFVEYCAEPLENDGSPLSPMFKGLKRAMAGEYGRELSIKVFAGKRRLIELGFRQRGAAGFGR